MMQHHMYSFYAKKYRRGVNEEHGLKMWTNGVD